MRFDVYDPLTDTTTSVAAESPEHAARLTLDDPESYGPMDCGNRSLVVYASGDPVGDWFDFKVRAVTRNEWVQK